MLLSQEGLAYTVTPIAVYDSTRLPLLSAKSEGCPFTQCSEQILYITQQINIFISTQGFKKMSE